MDTFRGIFGSSDFGDASDDFDLGDDETGRDLPPANIGQDERRMQVRAYNHWASLLGDRKFPSIDDLEPENLLDFGPYSVLLDFSNGVENPSVQYLGEALAEECGTETEIKSLADVPSRSLLSRITDHYMQILANQAPIGFEAEFVNQRDKTILYRGILLPYSSDDDTIDFIYGVINWKELADQATADELLLEIDQALDTQDDDGEDEPHKHHRDPVTDWADGPANESDATESEEAGAEEPDKVVPLADGSDRTLDDSDLPLPSFGHLTEPERPEGEAEFSSIEYDFSALSHPQPPTRKKTMALPDPAEDAHEPTPDHPEVGFGAPEIEDETPSEQGDGLFDFLAAARDAAQIANSCEDRSRSALYDAVSRAYDFSLVARDHPEDYAELLEECGIKAQSRAPMTPVVKLVFGADYDKTRLTEYAAVLSHAHRLGVERGKLRERLTQTEGGLKAIVKAERELRRQEAGKPENAPKALSAKLAEQLRALEPRDWSALAPDGEEFALVMVRRSEDGDIHVLGEVPHERGLLTRAAKALVEFFEASKA